MTIFILYFKVDTSMCDMHYQTTRIFFYSYSKLKFEENLIWLNTEYEYNIGKSILYYKSIGKWIKLQIS